MDLLIFPEELAPQDLQATSMRLFTDRLMCAIDQDHPDVGDQMTAEQFRTLPFVAYDGTPLQTIGDLRLRELGIDRPIEIRTQSFVVQPLMLPGGRFMALVHERLGRYFADHVGIRLVDPPFPIRPMSEAMFFEFLVNTGLRRGEAMALTWDDVDLKNRLIRVRGTLARVNGLLTVLAPKSAKSRRSIPLSDPATDVLLRVRNRTDAERELAAQLWVNSRYVFVTEIGEPCDRRNALRALTVAARRAGLEGVGLHTLRHSAASVMLSQAVPLNVDSQVLGHSGISITADVYGHIAPDVSRNALDVLGAALSATSSGTMETQDRDQ